jgi:hypothetical protein
VISGARNTAVAVAYSGDMAAAAVGIAVILAVWATSLAAEYKDL